MPTAKRKPAASMPPEKRSRPAARRAAAPAPVAPMTVAAPAQPPRDGRVSLRRLEKLTLVLCLVLAGISLNTMQHAKQTAKDVRAAKIDLHSMAIQRTHYRSLLQIARREAEFLEMPAAQGPTVLASVVRYRDGEEELLQRDLVVPILSYHAMPGAPALKAVLLERRNAASTDVTVRLFMDNGTEESYLWPSTHSENGVWRADCATDVTLVTPQRPHLCPAGYPETSEVE